MTERTVAITRSMPAPRERVVIACTLHDEHGEPQVDELIEVTLAEDGGRTRLDLLTKCSGRGEGARRMVDGMPKGWSQTLSRLQTQFDTDK